ncbi:MAG: adenosylhomocysteinase [Planctomycetes bacterium SM23_32]|nr:MAG: adenosylhomocysteinase [Planctomycetes bacterium SM23_32]
MDYDITDVSLAEAGVRRVQWADCAMPVLAEVRERFEEEKPLEGVRISGCLHITAETANLARTLTAGGAELVLCASNPLSTQDEVAAALVESYGTPVFARRGEDEKTYYSHITGALAHEPNVTIDDGADLVTTILTKRTELAPCILGSLEETTTGVNRLRAMEADGVLQFPVFAVNDAMTKHLFDNRYGTGQSTVDGILRATGVLLAGMNVVVAGYGMCGRGLASRMDGMGAHVIVTEVDPLRALEAAMDGFAVMPMSQAASQGDLFVTVTGNTDVLRQEHFLKMRDGAILANSGHFNVEIAIGDLSELAEAIARDVRPNVDEFRLEDGRRLYLLGEGRLINLAAAEGHPACVMDMSFAVQALTAEFAVRNRGKLPPAVHPVPDEIDKWVARLKLRTMRISIDSLSRRQQDYMAGWQEGT